MISDDNQASKNNPYFNPKKPNILLFVADDLGWNDIGYHNTEIRTPFIDSLAYEGIRLENYYVQPMCTASRSQLLTGRYDVKCLK